jgi:hypothetical protein
MAAPTNAAKRKKALANPEPSTHGTWCRLAAMHNFVAARVVAGIEQAAPIELER